MESLFELIHFIDRAHHCLCTEPITVIASGGKKLIPGNISQNFLYLQGKINFKKRIYLPASSTKD
jgi:hypothetical protein